MLFISSDEVHSIQYYVIKFVSDLRQVGGFLPVSSTKKTDHHDIAEILLKLALNTNQSINQSLDIVSVLSDMSTRGLLPH